LQIRPLNVDDAAAYARLRLFALQESASAFGSSHEEEKDRSIEQWRERVAPTPDKCIYGAEANGELVGTLVVARDTGLKTRHRANFFGMYVAPSHRGTGLGSALVARGMAHAKAWDGVRQISLAVRADNAPAIATYQRAGFVTYGVDPKILYVAGVYHDEWLMVRELAA
jgi:RimJ/RimL family protein N-acetyltransferase